MILLACSPFARAGSPDAPELTDAADDCDFAPGNHYADITAAWISDETPTDFQVNIQLSKWTAEHVGTGAGYTIQFTHQGMQFGVLAFYGGALFGGWGYANGYVDVNTGTLANTSEAEGSFTPGSPALLTISFSKSHFPHTDSTDNALRAFNGGTADFKPPLPVWLAEGVSGQDVPVEPSYLECDIVVSDAIYTFQTGGHSMHAAPADAAPANATAPGTDALSPAAATPSPGSASNESPGPGLALALGALLVALLARRRS